MTWEELKEEAKKMGYELQRDYLDYLSKCFGKDLSLTFQEYGDVCIDAMTDFCNINITFTEHRTPDQMFAIMKALQ